MPTVVLPSSPALRNFGTYTSGLTNIYICFRLLSHLFLFTASSVISAGHRDDMSVAEIKEKVKHAVQRVRGATPTSLLKFARDYTVSGFEREANGDIPGSLNDLLTAAELCKLVMVSEEFKKEIRGKKGLVYKDFTDFQQVCLMSSLALHDPILSYQHYGADLISRANSLESRLSVLDKSYVSPFSTDRIIIHSTRNSTNGSSTKEADGLVQKSGGSIADRMKSLQDAGLSVSTTKRFSRDLSPTSNAMSRASSSHGHTNVSSPPPSHTNFHSISTNPTESSAHSFVAPSSLGPPSPTSSSSSPPPLPHGTISEFNQAYPPIDELDELPSGFPILPSVPTTKPGASITSPLASPSVIGRFPSVALDLDPTPRPSSTPVVSNMGIVTSRPPTPPSFSRVPLSPAIPPKPINLSTGSSHGSSSTTFRTSPSRSSPNHTGDHSDLPVTNSVFPKQLRDYLTRAGLKVLLLDVRPREEFSKGHIRANAVVCLDPYFLIRDGYALFTKRRTC